MDRHGAARLPGTWPAGQGLADTGQGTGLKVPIYCLCNIISRQRFSFFHSGSIHCTALRAPPVSDTLQTEGEEELRTGESMLGLSRRCQVVSPPTDCRLLTNSVSQTSNLRTAEAMVTCDGSDPSPTVDLGNYYHQETNFGTVTTGGLQILILFSQESLRNQYFS